ncbi:MAG: hypothetical protein OXK21_01680 [Chloroflexota bacterium]|nr:hypothetical protein [Chloroflexota bacterium]
MDINDLFSMGLSFDEALDLLSDVAVYVLGMTVYAIFVFKFYRFLARQDMFELDMSRYEQSRVKWLRKSMQVIFYIIKYIIVFPVFAFFWFGVLTTILAFLSKGQSFSETLLVALATVSAIRVTAYYDEDLSRDLAKILPFAVLAVFLIDASFFSIGESLDILQEAEGYTENIVYYMGFLVLLEFALRIINAIVTFISRLGQKVADLGDAEE